MNKKQASLVDKRPVLIMAGGTGGHIFPGLAVASRLRERGIPVIWLGAQGGMETRLVPEHGIHLETVAVTGLRGKGWLQRLVGPLKMLLAVVVVIRLIWRIKPRSVLSMGGYVAAAGGVAAWLMRKPLLVHEQNKIPGMTNTWLAKMATCVMTGFDRAFKTADKVIWVGNPVRPDIGALPTPEERFAERSGPLRVLILGGSLGARWLNQQLPAALAAVSATQPLSIWHQGGQRGIDEARKAYTEARLEAQVDAFIADMASAYAWADVVICRAGALTIAELSAVGLGGLLVPFPHAVDDHQTHNGQALVEAGGAMLIQERDMNPSLLAETLQTLLSGRKALLEMAMASRTLARPQAANDIADFCQEAQK